MLTVLATGKTLAEALKITNGDVSEALGGLPEQKLLCSNIAADALHAAINNYTNKKTNLTDKTVANSNLSDRNEPDPSSSETIEGLTDENQIKRYLRHIIMPDIGGLGQKNFLIPGFLSVHQTVQSSDLLIRYLTAIGIGHIDCFFENKAGWELALKTLSDLNPDVTFQLSEYFTATNFTIIIGNTDYATKMSALMINSASSKISPTFISINEAWQGCFRRCQDKNEISAFLDTIKKKGFS